MGLLVTTSWLRVSIDFSICFFYLYIKINSYKILSTRVYRSRVEGFGIGERYTCTLKSKSFYGAGWTGWKRETVVTDEFARVWSACVVCVHVCVCVTVSGKVGGDVEGRKNFKVIVAEMTFLFAFWFKGGSGVVDIPPAQYAPLPNLPLHVCLVWPFWRYCYEK